MNIQDASCIQVSHDGNPIQGRLKIGGSKSISNRVLILNALSDRPGKVNNLSSSDDTITLQKLLQSEALVLDAHHAGTTYRFLTAYLCLQKGKRTLTGSPRMLKRPIGPLVDALRALGAEITYLGEEGYPPLEISGQLHQISNEITIRSDVSSQFLSALCMIAPCLEKGLILNMEGELVSRPYLEMTLHLMSEFGVKSEMEGRRISIKPQSYASRDHHVESDWSSASYFFLIAAIAEDVNIELEYFYEESLQGDSSIGNISHDLGVVSKVVENVLHIRSAMSDRQTLSHDFLNHPDIAQTIAVACAARNIPIKYNGLKTLFIKETNRITALQKELAKVKVHIRKDDSGRYEFFQEGEIRVELPEFETYEDHRMAMSLAPLALLGPIQIKNPKVVSKSYPNFWTDLETLGFQIKVVS